MRDLDERFRALGGASAPDLWPDIERRAPRARRTHTPTRWVAAAAAFALAGGGLFLASRAFQADRRPERLGSAPPEPVVGGTTDIPGAYAVVTGEGSVWVGARALDGECDGTIHRIDPSTEETIARIPVDGIAGWEVGGGGIDVESGAVWVAGNVCGPGGEGTVLQRIDTTSNEVDQVADLGTGLASDVDATGDAVWVTVFRERSNAELLRIDPRSGLLEATIPMEASYAREVLAAHGAVWVHPREVEASTVGSGYLVKVDPGTNEVAGRLDVTMEAPAYLDGSLWAHQGDAIIRIDPASPEIADRFPDVGFGVYSVLRPGAGGLWFLRSDDTPGEGGAPLVRFNPATERVDVVADLGPDLTPIDLAVTDSKIWVVNYEGSLTRVDLRYP